MRKLVLTASLCVVALVVAPLASAGGARFIGACVIKGTATFGNGTAFEGAPLPVLGKLAEELNYKLRSEQPGTDCVHLNVTEAEELAKAPSVAGIEQAVESHDQILAAAEVKGSGNLSCERAESRAPGSGFLQVDGVTAHIEIFEFVGTGAVWLFTAEPTFAAGEVLLAADTATLDDCAPTSPRGHERLKFTAVAAGAFR
jgi:hypothetical protein